ncbi:MAG: hypothetical protein R3256_01475 [Thalassovita sp.]|nr:hypothetical protein [Thalassovita sp.]
MDQVVLFAPQETIRMNRGRLGEFYRRLGDSEAEDIITRAVEALSARLAQCQRLYRAGRLAEMRRNLRTQIAIADQIGLQSVSQAAGHVLDCVERRETVALAATLARLLRIGDLSFTELWETRNLSV